jgi:hypothetical protein
VDRLRNRAYIGQYSQDGQYFVAAFQVGRWCGCGCGRCRGHRLA